MDIPAVVLGLSGTGLSAVRQLGRRGIRVTGVTWASSDTGIGSRYCDTKIAPDPSTDGAELAAFLTQLPLPQGTVLLPCSDEAVLFVQTYAATLAGRFLFYRFPRNVADMLINKELQYKFASAAGLILPDTFYPSTLAEVADIAERISYPAFIKAHYGHLWVKHFTSKGMEVHSPEELRKGFATVFETGLEALVQCVIPGPATGLVSVCCHRGLNGQILGVFSQRKVRQLPLDFGVGTLVESTREPELEQAVLRFVETMDYRGTAEVEFKQDSVDGKYKYIELNARIWQQHSLAVSCGVDFAYLQYLELAGKPAPVMRQIATGIRWIALWEDLFASRALISKGRLTAMNWIRSVLSVRGHNTFAFDDPGPALRLYGGHLKELIQNRLQPKRRAGHMRRTGNDQ